MPIMGLETPVPMPTMNVYNTDLMKMYIAGVKEQYDTAREEMKDFMKQYLDFYSPIAGDTQAYNDMTIGGARDMINQMYAQGMDPYKSPEARAAIAQYIASRPAGILNAMKQNAENRKIYDRAVALAVANGTYNPLMEAMELERLGLNDFKTVGPGGLINTWDRLAPVHGKTLYELALPQFLKYGKTEDLGPGSRPFYRKRGVSDESKLAATEATIREMDATPYGKFYRKRAEEEVKQRAAAEGTTLTNEQLDRLTDVQLRKNVLDEMNSYLQPTEEVDQVGLTMWKLRQEAAEHAKNRAATLRAALVKLQTSSEDRTPLSRRIIDSSNLKALQSRNTLHNNVITNFISKAVEWRKNHPTVNGKKAMSPELAQKWWNNAIEDPVKYKLVDENGDFTDFAKTWFKRTGIDLSRIDDFLNLSKRFKKGVGPNQLRNSADELYNLYVNYDITSPKLTKYLGEVFTGDYLLTTPTGETQKVLVVNTANKGYRYSPARRISLFGGSKQMHEYLKAFDRFIRSGVTMYRRDKQVGVAGIPKQNGKSSIDVFGHLDMTEADFSRFCKSIGEEGNEEKVKKYLGLTSSGVQNSKSEPIAGKKGQYNPMGSRVYIRVPITKSIFSSSTSSYEFTDFDEEWEQILFGSNQAAKQAVQIEENSLE